MSKKPQIAVIIVGYKSRKYLPELFESLYKSDYPNFTVHYLANGEDQGSKEYIEENFPQVDFHESKENLGFAKGNNSLIDKICKQFKTDYFFLLNPDTIVDKECLTELAKAAEEKTLTQPLILLHKDGVATDTINTKGNPLHYLGFSYAGGNGQPESSIIEKVLSPSVASGAGLLISQSFWKQLGGFDESFFMYHEDTDLSLRARLLGGKVECIPSAKIWHKYRFSGNAGKMYYVERNRLLVMYKSLQMQTLLLSLPMLVLTELFMLAYSLISGWPGKKLKASLDAFIMMVESKKARMNIQKTRIINDRQLIPVFIDTLSFSEVDSLPVRLYNILSRVAWKSIITITKFF